MPNIVLTAEATLTERYQNTVPAAIRKALHLKKGDKVLYTIENNGRVSFTRAETTQGDPVLEKFLHFLADDMANNPDQLQYLTPSLGKRIHTLVGDLNVDLDSPVLGEDE